MSAIFLTTKKQKINRGISLIETILYMVILTLMINTVVQMFIAIGGIYRNIATTRELESSGTIVMENMLREIRNASSVNVSGSILGTSPGKLAVSGIDDGSNPYNVVFDVSSSTIRVSRDGGSPEALTSSSGSVSKLLFTRVQSDNSEAVRIELEMTGAVGSTTKTEKFYGFSSLRGSY